ncbi:MAG TPA: FAD-dependent oxidoreductase [Allosphingosinicella sp.]|nr:FAD-dependent oxidoreductase [Allosphingosinicella sp.]
MAAAEIDPDLPDFGEGVAIADIAPEGVLAGRIGNAPVLLSRIDGSFFAVGGACTHYGAALSGGLRSGETIRCPHHHACFSLRTGAALGAPAFRSLDRMRVERIGERLFVREALPPEGPRATRPPAGVRSIVIVGAGAAGYACASKLRDLGYDDRVVLIGREPDAPYDRPNLSKDYLAGTAPEEWMPLADSAFYPDRAIELRLGLEVMKIDPAGRSVLCSTGESLAFDRLLLAPGAEPVRLAAPGLDAPNVHTLRSFADARALGAACREGARAVILGSGFISLEAAAALTARGVGVDIVTLEGTPFQRLFGPEVGAWLQRLHEHEGVRFHTGRTAAGYAEGNVLLDDGRSLAADFVLLGIGVRPNLGLAQRAGLAVGDGILVDECLATSAPGIYAAGDAASYATARGRRRIEHWVTAQRQGEAVAANMLGADLRFDRVPFFWSEQHGVALRYVGHAATWWDVRIEGSLDENDFTARYFEDDALVASLSVGRDRENLEDEARLERSALESARPREPAGAAVI